jgi:hypothetical protein
MESSASPQVAPGKVCGSCMMCCKLPPIPELEKAAARWCQHAAPGKGCSIYENRPTVCRRFYCHWMVDPGLGPEWKPDRAKFVMFPDRECADIYNVMVDPAFPDAWTKPPYLAAIKKWVAGGAALGRFALVHTGPRLTAVLPDRIVDLGTVKSKFALVRERDPSGKTIGVRVRPD